jgi:hypothetical protein
MTAIVKEGRPRAQELLARMGPELYRQAYEAGMNLSAWLEEQDPSQDHRDGLDAFERVLMAANIRTRSIVEAGIYAHRMDAFFQSAQTRALLPEFLARVWRRAAYGRGGHRAIYLSDDNALGGLNRPWSDAAMGRWDEQIAPAIPVSELVAATTPIDGDAYRAFYLTSSAANSRMVRVGEGAEIPRAKLTAGDQTVRLFKYGRGLEITYEQLRRMRIDVVALHLARMAVQAEVDKVATILDVIVNGDGNANTAAEVFNLTTLDAAATAGTLSLAGWLAFKMQFANPYMATTALAREGIALAMLLLNTGSANVPLLMLEGGRGFGSFRQINPNLADGVALGWTADAPASQIVAFDRRFAIERVVETGATIEEVTRFVERQTELLVMTETEGYAVMDREAAKILNIAA